MNETQTQSDAIETPPAPKPEPIDVINQYTGEKWYYSDIVKEHFFKPRNLLLEDPKPGEFNATGKVGSPACIHPKTLLQLNPTFRAIRDVQPADPVLGHDGLFHSVERIFRPKYGSGLVKLENQLGELIATPDHLVYAMQVPRTSGTPFVHINRKMQIPPSWVHAGDLKKGDVVLYPIPREIRPLGKIEVPATTRKQYDFKSRALPQSINLTSEVLELFGYFIAEGHTRKNGKEVGFTFSAREFAFAKRVKFLVRKYFHLETSISLRPKNNRIDVCIYNVHLAAVFRQWFGHVAEAKRIPEFILFLDPKLQRGLLKGLWLGDGFFSSLRSQPRAGFATVSETLLQQMVWLLMRQKIIPSVYREPAKRINGVSHQKSFRLHVGDMTSLERLAEIIDISFARDPAKRHAIETWCDKQFCYLPLRHISAARFRGRLQNLEVQESHTYATNAFLAHNCGDMMFMWLKIDPAEERIQEMKWRTFGCASAIAATSMFSVMITENGGMTIADALKVRPQDIMVRLGGLPNRKIHCSVLADKAFRKAANNYFHETGQHERVVVEGARVIDPKLNITDHDIEEAVLEGATDLDSVQQKLKVGIGSPEIITDVEQLIRFYKEKYYG